MIEKKIEFTPSQKKVIEFRGKNMLVSASAGTGKTTTMIKRIVELLKEGVDLSEIVVVTFTNLAAAEMKAKLAEKLAEIRDGNRMADQLEKIDNAAICTLHSFCVDLLRNYFYVADIDPSFAILDTLTVASLRKNALNRLFEEYFSKNDEIFRQVYKIFSTHRREDNFRDTITRLYDFGQCLENFDDWYAGKRQNFLVPDNNPILNFICRDVRQTLKYYASNFYALASRANDLQMPAAEVFVCNADKLYALAQKELQGIFDGLCTLTFQALPNGSKSKADEFCQSVFNHYGKLKKDLEKDVKSYVSLCRNKKISELWQEMRLSVAHVDKIVELTKRFGQLFWEEKRERGGIDFNDLEHLVLQLLHDPETLEDIHNRYKHIFVDEYQDINPVQESIINLLAQSDNLFMVGDVKQSIYGFRGCDPTIFAEKYSAYKRGNSGEAVELNDNFRSNKQILNFVNQLFDGLMTEDFGAVDYKNTAQLCGKIEPVFCPTSVQIDIVATSKEPKEEAQGIYDITLYCEEQDGVRQGELVANNIKQYVGKVYADEKGNIRRIGYGDVVVLVRSMKDRAVDIYNALVAENIPVAASFKVEGYSNKEVRDIVNLLRVIDNPFNDVYMVGACLVFGELTESELVYVRLDTEGRVSFYERLMSYADKGSDKSIANKIKKFLDFLKEIRFYSYSEPVCDTVLKIIEKTQYGLFVTGLPNGALRLGKLRAFVDSLKGTSYAQSVDKFLTYIDETEEKDADVQNVPNAVRIMTMHASKGLEFPVVILAGLETGFNFRTHSLKTDGNLGIAMDYYNMETMRYARTFGSFACDLSAKQKQREEEMRLLYVAATRAKQALNLVATVREDALTSLPKPKNRAMCHFDWLHTLLYGKYNSHDPVFDGVNINIYKTVEKQEHREQPNLCEQTVSVEDVRRKTGFVYWHKQDVDLPSKVVSSQLDKEYIDLTEEPQPEIVLERDGDRNEIGTAYHKVYQYVDYSSNVDQIRKCITELVNDGKIEEKFADRLNIELIYDTLHNPDLQRLLAKGKVYHEIPFMLYVPYGELFASEKGVSEDNVMLQGVIDLLIIGDKHATVIDFKYTGHSDLVEQRYRAQLRSYRLAVERICGITDVESYVLSIADNKLIKL